MTGVQTCALPIYDDFTIESFAKKGENNLPESKAGGNKILKVFTNNGDIQIDIKNKSFNKGNKKRVFPSERLSFLLFYLLFYS